MIVHRALLSHGFINVVTSFDIRTGSIASVVTAGQQSLSDASDALASLPTELRTRVELSISDGSVVVPQHAHGGMEFWRSGAFECTTGWTVEELISFTWEKRLVTAGHCSGLVKVKHPTNQEHASTKIPEHQGHWGDFEYHNLDSTNEIDDFYYDTNSVRDVQAVEPHSGISVNETVCFFGRASNDADCTAEVQAISIACGSLDLMVQMNDAVTINGDSGGPWYVNYRAYGVHFGLCDGLSTFSSVDHLDEAFGNYMRVATN